jgi:hypothetical protein
LTEYVTTTTIPFTAVRTLNATPVTVASIPWSQFGASPCFLIPRWIQIYYDYGTAPYDSVGAADDLEFRYQNAAGTLLATVETVGFLDQSSDQFRYILPISNSSLTPQVNQPIVARIATGEIYTAAGDGVIRIRIGFTAAWSTFGKPD